MPCVKFVKSDIFHLASAADIYESIPRGINLALTRGTTYLIIQLYVNKRVLLGKTGNVICTGAKSASVGISREDDSWSLFSQLKDVLPTNVVKFRNREIVIMLKFVYRSVIWQTPRQHCYLGRLSNCKAIGRTLLPYPVRLRICEMVRRLMTSTIEALNGDRSA